MTKEEKLYVDIRFHLNKEVEEYKDEDGNVEESWTSYDIDYVERKKFKGVTEYDLDSLGESFFQMDSYQEFFATDVPHTIYSGTPRSFK